VLASALAPTCMCLAPCLTLTDVAQEADSAVARRARSRSRRRNGSSAADESYRCRSKLRSEFPRLSLARPTAAGHASSVILFPSWHATCLANAFAILRYEQRTALQPITRHAQSMAVR